MMGVPGGPPPPEAPCIEYYQCTCQGPLKMLFKLKLCGEISNSMDESRCQGVFSPHMHQEKVMSKASETKNTNFTDQKWECKPSSIPFKCHHSSFDHPNTIIAICGNRDT